MTLFDIKELIENNPVALSTITENNKPNVIIVDGAKIVSDNQIVITDNLMNRTINDIINNGSICLVVWNKDLKRCKIIGTAEYFTEGKWKKYVEEMSENEGLPAKGAILVKVGKIIPSF